ncbi:tyrosine-type recombinase/integrase [Roseococcus sp. SDR]|uniref:tyrosine-type recombinase/integrase n=1 Tax=Roseococcus sp. SDR TaxID=2835532 RepID=UPI001BCBBA37|nr:tyrosine-type recombinase/integrase [Roseococcus sp. SDR]MBS7789236.1 tyrosine-type recombinase/integrase [Roseococcus sp. SDR]MBV1844550.1 tyrosine-type recombinase/integrase [Roseococcus sp. SDR]
MSPSIRLRHIHTFRDRHGRERIYLRMPGCKAVALPTPAGSPEFMLAYQAAIAAAQRAPLGQSRTTEGSLDALAVSFYGSDLFRGLRTSTQAAYTRIIEGLRAKHGTKPIRMLDAIAIRRLVAERAGSPTAGNHRLRMLRLLSRHAMALGWLASDPTAGIEPVAYRTDGYATWSDAEIAAYRAKHPTGSTARLALELLLCTGQRRSDVVRMGPQHVKGGAIHLRQVKTGQAVAIPILPELAAELAALPHRHLTWLATQDGTARSPRGFYNAFRRWCDDAGIAEARSPHGLRKACGVMLAEAGCTAHEIMAILGHRTLAEAQKYTVEADRRRMAESGMQKVAKIAAERLARKGSGTG